MKALHTTGTEFEVWFETEWPRMMDAHHKAPSWESVAMMLWVEAGGEGNWHEQLDRCVVPPEAWSHPAAGHTDLSWDRRAAWLVYSLLRPRGATLNSSTDLFGPR